MYINIINMFMALIYYMDISPAEAVSGLGHLHNQYWAAKINEGEWLDSD